MQHATPEEIAWAAGLFEGEGWWGVRRKHSAEAVLGTTDRDVAEAFGRIVGVGTLSVENRTAKGHKTLYRWSVCSAKEVRTLIETFWPWLKERRRETALVILAATENCRGRSELRTHCPRGHPYDEANTYLYRGYRKCLKCSRDSARNRGRELRGTKPENYRLKET